MTDNVRRALMIARKPRQDGGSYRASDVRFGGRGASLENTHAKPTLMGMRPDQLTKIARGMPGYAHLQQAAQDFMADNPQAPVSETVHDFLQRQDMGHAYSNGGRTKEERRAFMIARDQRALLRRIANIYPGPAGGMDPSPGGGGYSGPGGGKYIGPSGYADGGGVDDYGGEHRPPGPEDGAPLHDLKQREWRQLPLGRNKAETLETVFNPRYDDLLRLGREDEHGSVRILRDNDGNVHAWRGSEAIHDLVARAVGTKQTPDNARLLQLNGNKLLTLVHGGADERPLPLNEWAPYATGGRAGHNGGPALDEVPPFKLHSGAAKIIGAKGQAKATPQQYAAMPGIKPDELKHSNFDTLGSKALPREEVIKHLEDNRLPIEETQLGGEGRNTSTKFSDKTLPGGQNYREVLLHTPPASADEHRKVLADLEQARQAKADAFAALRQANEANAPNRSDMRTAYAQAIMRHDELQDKAAQSNRDAYANNYKSRHWDEPNVLAHVRMSDRRGPNGEKVLHVEEVQSDWGQQGREKGFGKREGKVEQQPGGFWRITWPDGTFSGGYDTQTSAETALEYRGKGVPHGPYVDNTQKWTDLALKRVLHEAAHGGYDKIAFTPGDEQNKRYDLSSHVKDIQYYPDTKYLGATTHDDRGVEHEGVEPDDLSKHIGKEAADRILKQPLQRFEGRGKLGGEFYHELEGEGLKVGGEGMRGYYDNILPKRLQALAQQHDPQAKVDLHAHDLPVNTSHPDDYSIDVGLEGTGRQLYDQSGSPEGPEHPTQAAAIRYRNELYNAGQRGVNLHSLDVTPQMRDSIKANGFNSFKRGGDVGMRQRYADGGETDTPAMNKALDLVSMFQPAKPMMAQRVAPQQSGQMTEPGSVSIKSLTESFDKAIQHHTSLGPEERAANSRAALQTIAPHLGKSKTGVPSPLLTKNAKLMKSEEGYKGGAPISLPNGQGVETTGLALAPAYQEGKFTTCPNSASCKKECLGKFAGGYFYAGGGQDPDALKGPRLNSVRKTVAMLREPEAFAVRLHDEIEAAKRMASMNNNMLGVRLNVLSDINPRVHKALFDAHPDVAFYDYTKNNTNPVAPNHHYTYSSTGVSDNDVDNPHSNWKQMRKRLDTGSNVAMAFSHKAHLPETVFDEETGKRYKVTNGDSHDFRPLDIQQKDQPGVIVGLRNKKISSTNAAAHRTSNGFFVRYNPDFLVGNEGKRVKDMHGNPIAQNTEVRIQHQKTAPTLKSNDEAETP